MYAYTKVYSHNNTNQGTYNLTILVQGHRTKKNYIVRNSKALSLSKSSSRTKQDV